MTPLAPVMPTISFMRLPASPLAFRDLATAHESYHAQQ